MNTMAPHILIMKNLVNKFGNSKKSTAKTIGKYVTMGAMLLGSVAYANAQTFDPTELAGMDFYSRPNIVSTRAYGDGDVNSDGSVNSKDIDAINLGTHNDYSDVNGDGIQGDSADVALLQKYLNGEIKYLPGDWNNLNRAEKISWLDRRVTHYINTWGSLPAVDGVNPDCGNYTMRFDLQFGGMDNFTNLISADYNHDGKKEGYDYYKNEVQNGKENIPIYFVSVVKKDGIAHFWPGVFVGSENVGEKDNPLDLNQWYIFDYGNKGEQIKPGDFGIDENSPVIIKWWGWRSDLGSFESHQLIPFYLTNGNASYKEDELFPFILKENPWRTYVKLAGLKDTNIEYEPGMDEKNLDTGEPTVETNSKFYKANVTEKDGDFIPDNPKYPLFGTFTKQFFADMKMGRWHKRDTLEQKITIRDNTPPVLNVPEDIEISANADTSVANTGMATATDNSPYPITMSRYDNELSNDGHYQVIQRTFIAMDVSGNLVSSIQKVTIDLTTDVKDLKAQVGFDIEPIYSTQGVNLKTFANESGKVSLEIFDMAGRLVSQKRFDVGRGTLQDCWINSSFSTGTYFFRGFLKETNGKLLVDNGKFEIR